MAMLYIIGPLLIPPSSNVMEVFDDAEAEEQPLLEDGKYVPLY